MKSSNKPYKEFHNMNEDTQQYAVCFYTYGIKESPRETVQHVCEERGWTPIWCDRLQDIIPALRKVGVVMLVINDLSDLRHHSDVPGLIAVMQAHDIQLCLASSNHINDLNQPGQAELFHDLLIRSKNALADRDKAIEQSLKERIKKSISFRRQAGSKE
jgi:hypothetical protein